MNIQLERPSSLLVAEPVWQLPGGRAIRLRPVAAADAGAEQAFFSGLSLDSRHKRFHVGLRSLSPTLLKLLTEVDQDLHVAWIAESLEPGRPSWRTPAMCMKPTIPSAPSSPSPWQTTGRAGAWAAG